MLTNLLSNAIKFTARGGITVTVSCDRVEPEDTVVRVAVEDTGMGIPADALSRIFETFQQADDSTTRRHGGTGLGLTISKRLVEGMGGELTVESTEGVGTRFEFTLWVGLPHGEELGSVEQPALSGRRVLVVDHERVCSEMAAATLGDSGAEVVVASDGPSALEVLRAAQDNGRPFDLALVERHMPGMDGMAVLRTLRVIPELAGTKVLMTCDSGAAAELRGEVAAGACGYLTKPLRPRALLTTVAAAFAGTVQDAEPPSLAAVRVLVAEDNAVNQSVADQMLRRLGVEVSIVPDGEQAVAALESGEYDLVLMDCQMPMMDGYQATRAIRGLGARSETPIVAMTANAMPGDRERCIEAGMDDYIAKPLQLPALERLVDRYTRGR